MPEDVTGEELARLLTLAIQDPQRNIWTVERTANGQLKIVETVQPVVIAGHLASDGTVAPADGEGQLPSKDANSDAIATDLAAIEVLQISIDEELRLIKNAAMINTQTRQTSGGDETGLFRAQKQLEGIPITLSGGTAANVVLQPALGGFHGYVQPICIWSDTADHYTFAFEDADDVDCDPGATPIAVETKANNEIGPFATTHGVAGDNSGAPPILPIWHGISANLAIEVDVAGGAGVEEIVLWVNRWFEDA